MEHSSNIIHLPALNNSNEYLKGGEKREAKDDLLGEAARLEAQYGRNAYSSYLRQHRKRPGKDQAAAIGRLLGGRVRADDGTMQPKLSRGERDVLRAIRDERRDWSRKYNQARRLKHAMRLLADNHDDPSEVFLAFQQVFPRESLGEKFHETLNWMKRFALEIHRHEQDASCKNAGGDS